MIARTNLLSVAALALLTTSCLGDPMGPETTGPDPLWPVVFEAVSANDRPLPAFINADGSTQAGRQLTNASVVITAPDSLRLILITRQVAENGESGAAVSDTLRAHIRVGEDSTFVLSRMGTFPLSLKEQVTLGRDGSVALTVEQPLSSPDGAVDTYPVELLFRRPGLAGADR
jgi:hypothetical protein